MARRTQRRQRINPLQKKIKIPQSYLRDFFYIRKLKFNLLSEANGLGFINNGISCCPLQSFLFLWQHTNRQSHKNKKGFPLPSGLKDGLIEFLKTLKTNKKWHQPQTSKTDSVSNSTTTSIK
jgi:hypothetical protein